MRTLAWIVLGLSVVTVFVAIFMIDEAKVGARLGRLLAVVLASCAFYSPVELYSDVAILPALVRDFSSSWPLIVFMAIVVVAAVFCIVDLIVNRRKEIEGLKDAGAKFAVIGVAGVIARVCAGYLF
jgi:hypothetical protein